MIPAEPPDDELARAERAGWEAVRAAGLDATDDSHLWQAVFFAAQRAELAHDGPDASGAGV